MPQFDHVLRTCVTTVQSRVLSVVVLQLNDISNVRTVSVSADVIPLIATRILVSNTSACCACLIPLRAFTCAFKLYCAANFQPSKVS